MEAAALAARDGRSLTWRPSASSRTATGLLLQMPRSSCIVLHGVDLEFSPAPGGTITILSLGSSRFADLPIRELDCAHRFPANRRAGSDRSLMLGL
jgi:hypothetical protein